jgi:hypothetical protein
VQERVAARLDRALPVEPVRLLAQTAATRDLTPTTPLRPREGARRELVHRAGSPTVELRLDGRTVTLPAGARPALERLLAGPTTAADLLADDLDEESALVLARRMLREGVLVPADH